MTISTYSAYDAVTVRRVVFPRASTRQPEPAYRMLIAPVDQPNKALKIPYAPKDITHTHAVDYADVDRAGRKPALIYKTAKRKEMSFVLYVADKYRPVPGAPTAPVLIVSATNVATILMDWARAGTRLRITYGYFENNNWRITDISTRSINRSPTSNEFTSAEITMTLSEIQDLKIGTGPVSGGVKPAPSKKTPAPKTRTYTVVSGDSLFKISIKYYGTGNNWRKIADVNKLKTTVIRPGQKLKIP